MHLIYLLNNVSQLLARLEESGKGLSGQGSTTLHRCQGDLGGNIINITCQKNPKDKNTGLIRRTFNLCYLKSIIIFLVWKYGKFSSFKKSTFWGKKKKDST